MQYLRQSTASQSVLIGPFVDSTDGVTAETGLTIANTDIRLSANGGNMFAKTSGGATHDEAGWYTITLDATDTATVGRLQLSVAVAGALPVFAEFQVLEEAVFDSLFAASALGPATEPIVAKYHNVREWTVKGGVAFKEPGTGDNGYATWPRIVGPVGGVYYLLYTGYDGSKEIIRIQSLGSDLDNLTPTGAASTIIQGVEAYEAGGVYLPVCEIRSGTLHLYYTAMPSAYTQCQIAYATCSTASDPTVSGNWTKQGIVIAHDRAGLPAALHGGFECNDILEWNSAYWMFGNSNPGGNRPTPASGANVSINDRRAFVARSTSLSDWSAAEFRMIMAESDQPSRIQPYRYLTSPAVFRQSSSTYAPFYMIAVVDATNTDFQRAVILSCHNPWFDKEYTQEEFTCLLTKDAGGTWPNGEMDVFSVLVSSMTKDSYPSNKFRVVFGGRDFQGTWSTGLIEIASVNHALRPGIRGAANNVQKMLAMRAGSAIETLIIDAAAGTNIASAAANKIADHVRRRTQANVEASSDGDALSVGSMYGLIQQAQESNTVDNAGFLTVYRTDGITELAQRAVTTDAAAVPITGIS